MKVYLPGAASTQFGAFPAGINDVNDAVAAHLALYHGAVAASSTDSPRVLAAQEYQAFKGMVSGAGNLTATYDGSGRMLSLARAGGRRVAIAYPSSTAMLVTEQDVPTPAIITCITDTSGRVTSAAPNW